MSNISENIWKQIQDDDEKAFKALFEKYYNCLCFYASQIVHNDQLSEELVQDVFVKLWNNRTRIIITGSLQSYLYQSVHNQAINSLKHLMTEKLRNFLLVDEAKWKFIENNYAIDDFLMEKIEAQDTAQKIEKAIEELPDQCREIFKHSRFEDKSVTDLARQFKVTENTIRTHLFRALAKIKKTLQIFL